MNAGERPVGSWCLRISGLLDEVLDRVLARHGARRRHWHVLLALRDGPRTRAQVAEAMLPLWLPASVTQTDVVDDLVRRGWARTDASSYLITEEGAAAHARIAADVAAMHEQCAAGFASAEYAALVEGLAKVAAHLERALTQR